MDKRLELRLEPLEQRLLLDGNVLVGVIGGELFVVGDGAANEITIWRDGDFIVVSGVDGTDINGINEDDFYAPLPLSNINISMNEGDDAVVVDNIGFGGNINYEGGDGHDDFLLVNSGILGSLNLLGGFGDDDFLIDGVGVGGSVTVGTGRGEDDVLLADVGMGGSLSVESTGGELDVLLDGVGVRGDVAVAGVNSQTEVLMADVGIGGGLQVNADGPLAILIDGAGVRNGIDIIGGRWETLAQIHDVVTTDISVATGTALPGISPDFDVLVDQVGLGGNLSITGGVGFGGGVQISNVGARGSIDVVFYDADGEGIEMAVGGGSPADQVVAGGGISLAGYNGEFSLAMQYVTTGGSLSIAGNLLMQVQGRYLAARGDFNVGVGQGFGLIQVQNVGTGGDLNVTGADGIEGLEVINAGVRGDVNVNTGDGSVEALIGGVGIGGSLNLSNGTGAIAFYEIVETAVGGNLSLASSALFTGVEIAVVAVRGNVDVQTGVGGDEVWVADSFVRGGTAIRTDGGNDTVGFSASVLLGNVLVEAGGGEDYVGLAGTFEADTAPPLVFGSGVTVRMGSEDDFLEVGGPNGSGETVQFNGSALFDGGPNVDTALFGGFNTFAQPPTVVGFEIFP
jgi:hypothetical protein